MRYAKTAIERVVYFTYIAILLPASVFSKRFPPAGIRENRRRTHIKSS